MRTLPILTILIILGIAARLGAGCIGPANLTADYDGYLAHAEMVVNGEGFAGPSTHRPTAFRPPAYPIAVAALRVCGLPGSACVAIINGSCSIAIIWLTWILCRQLRLSPGVSVFATAATAFDPLLVRYALLPMTEVPAAGMLTAAVVTLNAAQQRHKTSGHGGVGFYILSGVLFGLGSLVRPIIFVSCVMLVPWRLLRTLKLSPDFRNNLAAALLPMIAAVLTISPWIIRNALQFGKFIPATTHGGYTLALGNNPDFYRDVIDGNVAFPWPGPQLDAWQQRMIADAAAHGVPAGNESAQDAWYYQQAIASIKAQPQSFFKACLLRFRRFFAMTPGSNDGTPQLVRVSIAVWYGLIGIGILASAAGWIPVCWSLLKRIPDGNIPADHSLTDLCLVIMSFMLLHSVYWTDTRMRAPVMPFICILAAAGWQSLFVLVFHSINPKTSPEL